MNQLDTIQSIFKESIFKIPDYQRGYAWTPTQLQQFWEDLINLPQDRKHYTGVLTLKKVDTRVWEHWNDESWLIKDRNYKPYHIVDGQQRLTTTVIFIQTVMELLRKLPENIDKSDDEIYLGTFSLKAIKENYLVISKPPNFIINTYLFSYEKDNPSFQYLRYKILGEPNGGKVDETFYTLNLQNAKTFFTTNLKKHYEENGVNGISGLFRKVTQNFMYNKYEIGDDFDVFVAFETMNNRGKQLSNLELLKNRLIYLTTLYEPSEIKDDERNALRTKINDAWKGVYHQLGRDKQHPLNDDDFLMNHWIMYYTYSRKKGNDYITFLLEKKFTSKNIFNKIEVVTDLEEFEEITAEDDILDDQENGDEENDFLVSVSKLRPQEIEDYVGSLKELSLHWYNTYHPIDNPSLSSMERVWLERLNRLGMGYFRPLVTVSFIAEGVTTEDRVRLFEIIERFIFICFRISRYSATYRNSEFYRAARDLRLGEIDIKTIITNLEERMKGSFYTNDDDPTLYFDYTHFKKYLERKFQNNTGFYGWNGLRYFLYEYEMKKVRNRGSKKIDWKPFVKTERDKVSIEHIFPQTPSKDCWVDAFGTYKENEIKFLTHTLGNLLPLSMSINSSLQNDCFKNKVSAILDDNGNKIRQGYNDGSHSEIEVVQMANDEWLPEHIKVRGIKMLKFLEDRWNLKFEDEEKMLDLLFLNFLNSDSHGD